MQATPPSVNTSEISLTQIVAPYLYSEQINHQSFYDTYTKLMLYTIRNHSVPFITHRSPHTSDLHTHVPTQLKVKNLWTNPKLVVLLLNA